MQTKYDIGDRVYHIFSQPVWKHINCKECGTHKDIVEGKLWKIDEDEYIITKIEKSCNLDSCDLEDIKITYTISSQDEWEALEEINYSKEQDTFDNLQTAIDECNRRNINKE